MSKVHSVSKQSSASRTHAASSAPKSQESSKPKTEKVEQGKETQKSDKPSEVGRPEGQQDGVQLSDEVKEEGKPGEGEEANKGEGEEKSELEKLQEEKSDLEALLEELEKQKELDKEKKEAKEPPGGCCGRPKSTGDKKGETDWNQVLLSDIAAVQLEKGGGKAPQQAGQAGPQQGGALPVGGIQGAGGAQQPFGGQQGLGGQQPFGGAQGPGGQPGLGVQGGAIGKLQSDYQMAKSSGAQLRPEVEQLVQGTLQGAGVQVGNLQGQFGQQQPGVQGIPGAQAANQRPV